MKKRNRDQNSIVYVATNLMDGAKYIGVTCNYLSRRKSKHFLVAGQKNSQTHFHRAIRKYGRNSFVFECVSEHPNFDEARKEEVRLILELKPRYNMTKGGDGSLGYRMPPDLAKRLADAKRGKPGPCRGKKLADSFIKGRDDWRISEEGKKSWKECRAMGPKSIQRSVVCLDDGRSFENSRKAAEFYDLSEDMIRAVCHMGRHKTAGGMVFRFNGSDHGGKQEADAVRAAVLLNRQRTAAIAREART